MPVGGANSNITGLRALGGKARRSISPQTYGGNTVLLVPHGNDAFYVTGSGTAALVLGGIRPGRVVKLIGATGTTVTITDTPIASSVDGAVHLTGGNFAFADARYLVLEQRENGSWIGVDQQVID